MSVLICQLKKGSILLNKRIKERVARIYIHVTNKCRYASATAVAREASSHGVVPEAFYFTRRVTLEVFHSKTP